MNSLKLNINISSSERNHSDMVFHHQYLSDLSLIHEKFIDYWFKYINYFNSHSGQLPDDILRFIDGLNFVECCFLQRELGLMAEIVADYTEKSVQETKDFYTEEYDMKVQVSAYMNYIDQRLMLLHQVQNLMAEKDHFPNFSIYYQEQIAG